MKKVKFYKVFLLGGLIGVINGFFGGGGGMIVVPTLTKFFHFSQKEAQATALFVILPISLISAIVYLVNNAVDFSLAWPVIVGIVAGGVIGALTLNKLKNNWVRALFIVFMYIGGIVLLVR